MRVKSDLQRALQLFKLKVWAARLAIHYSNLNRDSMYYKYAILYLDLDGKFWNDKCFSIMLNFGLDKLREYEKQCRESVPYPNNKQ